MSGGVAMETGPGLDGKGKKEERMEGFWGRGWWSFAKWIFQVL